MKKNGWIILVIAAIIVIAFFYGKSSLGNKAEPTPEPVQTASEPSPEPESTPEPTPTPDATGETYIEPTYSHDLVEAAHQWASKVDRKFADDNDMVHEFMADDAYITYIIYGTLDPDEEPVQQQPQQQPQQKPQQQQGNQGQQQQQQPTQQPSDGGSIDDARDFFNVGSDKGHTGADAGEIGDWELPGNIRVY